MHLLALLVMKVCDVQEIYVTFGSGNALENGSFTIFGTMKHEFIHIIPCDLQSTAVLTICYDSQYLSYNSIV